jgi:hypothetical protein
MDGFYNKWKPQRPSPTWPPLDSPFPPLAPAPSVSPVNIPSQEEIDEFRRLLEKARQQDEAEGNPDCGTEEKKKLIRELADQLGIKIDFV